VSEGARAAPPVALTPTRAAGLARLADFTPRMGAAYAAGRNQDAGPGAHGAVSGLSPWVRHRLVTEAEVIAAAEAAHGAGGAAKFVQEVLWRTYWKGWIEQRPSVWHDYKAAVARALADAAGEVAAVAAGRTGIACMDCWARELVDTGTLHNHARMWFASIWCFTLRLPWQLGADLFLRHLRDADAASNTLSWRWVAGLQTRGKPYIARAENIARYTGGRFNPVGELNEAPSPLPLGPPEPVVQLPAPMPPPQGRVALLIHEDDFLAETLPLGRAEVAAVGGLAVPDSRSPAGCAPLAASWARGALADGLDRAGRHFGVQAQAITDVGEWAEDTGCDTVISAYAPVGWTADRLAAAEQALADHGIRLHRLCRPWDTALWPHAQSGFFAFAAKAKR
jgi:deoxyribodipyrimidine photo-lyase